MNWSKTDINHIRVSLDRCNAQQLANELGAAKNSIKRKIREIEAKERLAKLSQYVKRYRD